MDSSDWRVSWLRSMILQVMLPLTLLELLILVAGRFLSIPFVLSAVVILLPAAASILALILSGPLKPLKKRRSKLMASRILRTLQEAYSNATISALREWQNEVGVIGIYRFSFTSSTILAVMGKSEAFIDLVIQYYAAESLALRDAMLLAEVAGAAQMTDHPSRKEEAS